MHDIDQAIARWRRELTERIGDDANVLDELESHLRDEIDRLLREGLFLDKAIEVAIAKLGLPETLAPEFAKVRAPWWPIRLVLSGMLTMIGAMLCFLGYRAAHAPFDGWLLAHVALITAGYLGSYGIGVLCLCYACQRMWKDLSIGQRHSWVAALKTAALGVFFLTLAGTVLGSIWARQNLGRFWDWDLRETGALVTLGWQAILLLSVWCFTWHRRWLMCWGMLGNITITFAWFVAANFTSDAQSHLGVLLLLAIVALAHGLAAVGGLAPRGWLRANA